MSDIIDDIDNLARDERDLRCEPNGSRWLKTYELLCAELVKHWPALSARLREAERSMAALAAVNTGLVGIGRNGTNYRQWCAWRQTHGGTDGPTAISEDLLTAIESALAAKETP